MFEALKNHLDEPKLSKPALREFVEIIEECRLSAFSSSISALMERILERTGLKKEYRDDNDEQRLENITELLNSMRMYELEHENDEPTLDDYLQDISLYTNADYRKETNKVKLMTVHQSKGLEFPYVFIMGLSEGIFPNARSIRERKKKALEEERRLMYVATTRAEKCLYMTESEGYNVQAQQDKLPSRFIAEIGRELFITEGSMDEALWERLKNRISQEEALEGGESAELHDDSTPSGIKVGGRVEHKVFGKGTVEEINNIGAYKVKFDKGGIRFLRVDVLTPVLEVVINKNSGKVVS